MNNQETKRAPLRTENTTEKKRSFVSVKRDGGWKTDLPALISSTAYQRQLDAVKDLAEKGHFSRKKSA
jgi:hypothetical protein